MVFEHDTDRSIVERFLAQKSVQYVTLKKKPIHRWRIVMKLPTSDSNDSKELMRNTDPSVEVVSGTSTSWPGDPDGKEYQHIVTFFFKDPFFRDRMK